MNIVGHILVIDDEETIRHTLARILQQAGHEVTTAATGQEGLALVSNQALNLVYLDIRMPDMSGLEVLKTIRSKYPEIPVALFTAQPDLSSAVEALRYGAVDYLLKPLQPKTLIDRTQTILAWQEKECRKREIQSQIEALQAELRILNGDEEAQTESTAQTPEGGDRFVRRGKLTVDLHARRLAIGAVSVDLPPTAFDYLLVLVRHAPNVVDCQTLVAEAQGYEAEPREAQELVKWHIHHIRQAIEPDAQNPTYVINVRGVGYRLVVD